MKTINFNKAIKAEKKFFALLAMVAVLSAPVSSVLALDGIESFFTTPQSSITLTDTSISPQTLTVAPGTTVVWTNLGSMTHTVTSDMGLFDSGIMYPGGSYSYTFPTAGTYNYYCTLHGGITGTVIVTGDSTGGTLNTLTATVSQSSGGTLTINAITPIQTNAIADGTYANGWKWTFDVTAPLDESTLMMKFRNWAAGTSLGSVIPVASNVRFYSSQSSNAYSQATAIYLNGSNVYSSPMLLIGNLGGASGRRMQITVEMRVPAGTPTGSYTTNFGLLTQ